MKQKYSKNLLLIICTILFVQCAVIKKAKVADQNKETIRIWFEEGWNKNRNEELLELCFSENWEDGNPLQADQIDGLEGMRQSIAHYREAFQDSHFTITHLFSDDKYVAIRYEVVSTHKGEIFGLEATGKSFNSTGIVLYEMENGKIKKSWQELDLSGIINQLKEGG